MKVNEKNLAAFATSQSVPADREGWLVKRGEINKQFQKRWFVLKGNFLFYFEKKTDKEPTGFIVLEGCTVELAEDEGQFGFKIVFHGQGNRTYVFEAESQDSMEQWMKALACASYDYLKLMVAELERQLQEMEVNLPLATTEDASSSGQPVAPPRTRHNPFNRGSPSSPHSRSHSIRSAPGRTDHDSNRQSRISFRELHTMYGRKVLQNFNEWKHQQRQLQQPLIQLLQTPMPIPKCCFPDCTNSRSKMNTLPGSRQVSFHRFPKNPDIRAKWKMSCKKPSDWDADQFLVCSDHFIDSDFEDDLKTRLLGSDRPRLLKSDAVPEHRVSEESLSPSDRLLKKTLEQKARKLLVESLLKDHELEQEALAMEIDEAITEDVDDLDRSKFESDSDTKSNCGEKKNRPTLMTTSGGVTIHHPQLDSILGTITPVIKAKANDPGSPSSGHEAASSHCSGDVKSLPVELDSQELFNLCQTLEKENVGLRKTIALLQNKLIDKDKKLNKIRKGLNIQLSNIFTKFAYDLERKYPSIPKPALRKMSRQKLTIKLKYQTK